MDLEAAWVAGQQKEGLAWCLQRLDHSPGGLHARHALEFALELSDEAALNQLSNLENGDPGFLALKSFLLWQRGRLEEALAMASKPIGSSPVSLAPTL